MFSVAATVVEKVLLPCFVLVYSAVSLVEFKRVVGVTVELSEVDATVNSVRFKPRFGGVVKVTFWLSVCAILKESTRRK